MINNKFEIIDMHAHLGSYALFPFRENTPKEIAEIAKSYGIKKMCVSNLLACAYDVKKGNLLTLKGVSEDPDFFLFGGLLDPWLKEEEIETEFLKIDSQVSMWNELHPALHKYPISGKGYKVILDLVKTNPKPVLFHTDEGDKYSNPGKIDELAKLYPEIPFIIGHSGNIIGGYEIAVDIAKKYDNVYLDSTFSRNYLGLIKWIIKKIGSEKIVFGTDMPFINGATQIGKIYEFGISDNDRQNIFHDNAVKLLRL